MKDLKDLSYVVGYMEGTYSSNMETIKSFSVRVEELEEDLKIFPKNTEIKKKIKRLKEAIKKMEIENDFITSLNKSYKSHTNSDLF